MNSKIRMQRWENLIVSLLSNLALELTTPLGKILCQMRDLGS